MKQRHLVPGLLLAALLAGCGSNVKLDDVPVEDRRGTTIAPGTQAPGGNTGGAPLSGVTPVQVDPSAANREGPANVARLVYFDYDSDEIKPEFKAVVDAHARFLRANPSRRVALEGHTDERGGREYNLALGQRRAEAVRRAMALLGVADSQLEAVSFGKEKPAATGSDEAAFAKNRRVEITYR